MTCEVGTGQMLQTEIKHFKTLVYTAFSLQGD